MLLNKKYIFLAVIICFGLKLSAQKVSFDNSNFFYQIYPIYNFKQSIVSLTFDDGSENQFKVGIPILKGMNIPATFYVITMNIDSTTKSLLLKDVSDEFEFGSHTATHPDLIKIGNEGAKQELSNSKSYLKKYFGINSGLTMSYPWGIYNDAIKQIVKGLYLAARTTDPGYNSFDNLDRYALKTQSFDKNTESGTANGWVDYAIQNHLWLVEMLHGINNIGYSPIDSSVLIKHLTYIKKVNDNIWCSTVSNVIKYIDESKNAKIECDFCNDTVYNIRVNDFMDDSIYNQQLSIRIKVPANWDSIWISNGEKVKTEFFNKSKFILFNALPDNKLLTIRPKFLSAPEINTGMRLVYLSANPFFDNIKFSLEVFDQTDIDIILCDLNGKLLIHQNEKSVNGVINLYFDTSGIIKGVYLLRVNSNRGDYIIKKLAKI